MQNYKKSIITYIIIILLSIWFMLLFAYNTSPLVEYMGVDSGMYLVMGKAMAQGKTLYADLFDHKGPFIFMINMLPQLFIDGITGVWLTELILIMIASIMIYKVASHYINHTLALIAPLIYIWVTVTLFNGGNYTEEYSNFFCTISLCMFDMWYRNRKLTSSILYTLGLCLAFVFFIRPNNIALIVSIILFIGIHILMKSRDTMKKVLLFGFLGFMTVTLPLLIYHLCAGTLYDMFYATILHNINYCITGAELLHFIPNGNSQQLLCFFIALGINVVAICSCYSCSNMPMGNFILLSLSTVSVAILIGRHPFMYYWTLLAPLTAYSSIFIMNYGVKKRKKYRFEIALVLLLLLTYSNSFLATKVIDKKDFITEYRLDTEELYHKIPESERNDIFAYNMPSMFIYEVNLKTPFKYFTMQTWMSRTNPFIEDSCTEYVKENQPKWILSYFQNKKTKSNPELSEMIRIGYTEVFSNDCGYLYRKVDSLP